MNFIYFALGVLSGVGFVLLVWQCYDLYLMVKRDRAIKELVKQLREQMPTEED